MVSTTAVSTHVEIDPDWVGVGSIFGGHVALHLVQAARLVDGFAPVAASIHFLGSVRSGPAELTAQAVHVGSATATVSVTLVQGHPRAIGLVKLARTDGATVWSAPSDSGGPASPELVSPAELRYGHLPYERFIDLRMLDAAVPFQSRGWVRLREPQGVGSPEGACELLDALPPGAFELDPTPSFVPTVEFTVHFVPGGTVAGEWYDVSQRLIWSGPDSCIEESQLRMADGVLVATARQTRRIVS
jgi:acyl-CoA thioesterase